MSYSTVEKPQPLSTIEGRMVLIPAGEFLMGSLDGGEFERPVHRVQLDSFYIDATPVTNAQFVAFVRTTGHITTAERMATNGQADPGAPYPHTPSWRSFAAPGREDHPVVCVSWFDADAYAQWAGKRLPTEAEWERAARGGLEGRLFPWGDAPPTSDRINWNRVRTDTLAAPPTTPVGAFEPNGFGIYDMAGNVWEWCADWYKDSYYSVCPDRNPKGPDQGYLKVRRGASWNVREAFRLRCANRGAMLPDKFWPNIGFRCALST